MKTTTYLAAFAVIFSLLFPSNQTVASNTEDNAVFGLYCPGDVWLDCYDEVWDLSGYGWAYYADYTGTHYLYNPVVNYYFNSCNTGYITRTWSVQDYHGYWHYCTQHIYVGGGGFNYNNINWPSQGLVLEGCNPNTHPSVLPHPYDYPTYDYVPCSLVAKSYTDQLFIISPSCKKVLRHWKIIDWCQYVPNQSNSPGIWEYTQVIKLEESAPPSIACPGDVLGWSQNCEDALVEIDPLMLSEYACGGYFTITNNSPYAFDDGNDISGVYPIGTTTVKYTINYACGKKMFCYVDVVVEDKKAPVPLCLGDIAAGMMTVVNPETLELDGMLEIWATDFDKGSYHTCRDGELQFSFSSDVNDISRVFTCEHVGTNELQLWVTDALGNQNYCNVNLHLQMNNPDVPNCQPEETEDPLEFAALAGRVTDMFDKSQKDVEINLEGIELDTSFQITVDTTIVNSLDSFQSASGAWLYITIIDTLITEEVDTVIESMFMEYMTDKGGVYDFEELEMYHDYMIKPSKSTSHAEGVDIADLQKVFRHVSGAEPFDNPLYYLMADVDQNGAVDINDVINMLFLYNGTQSTFPVESNWVFVSKNIDLTEVVDPFELQVHNYLYFESLEAELADNDFWGLQLGDLNGSIIEFPDKGSRIIASDQDKSTLLRTVNDTEFDLMYSELSIDELGEEDSTGSWIVNSNGRTLLIWSPENSDQDAIADLLLEQKKSNTIQIKAVHNQLGIIDIDFDSSTSHKNAFELLSTQPNPFSDHLSLSLFVNASNSFKLDIYNASGQEVYSELKSFEKGINEWQINFEDNISKGLLFYTLTSEDMIYSGKLIHIK